MQPYQPTVGERVLLVLFTVLLLSMVVVGAVLARRNLRLGRGDRHGASRLAAFGFVAWAAAGFFGAHHVPNYDKLELFFECLAWALLLSCFFWVLYIALEPYVRRRWPATLVSWSRLLAGGFRDPQVGRDVLAGCLWGASVTALLQLRWFVRSWLGDLPGPMTTGPLWSLLGARTVIAGMSNGLNSALVFSFSFLFVLFLFRVLLRKEWAAAVAFVLFFTIFLNAPLLFASGRSVASALVVGLILNGLSVFLLIRLGMLALVASGVFQFCFLSLPLTTQGSAWYAGISLAGILLMAAMAFYGFYTSLGGRPLFGGAALED
jgi:serine/threonine-protein kinase